LKIVIVQGLVLIKDSNALKTGLANDGHE
jgi:hypothetical protein